MFYNPDISRPTAYSWIAFKYVKCMDVERKYNFFSFLDVNVLVTYNVTTNIYVIVDSNSINKHLGISNLRCILIIGLCRDHNL